MKSICIFLATGFEEVEALFPLDILRRGGLSVKTVSVTGEPAVTGAHGVPVTADCLIEDLKEEDIEMIVLPGGLPGATNLDAHAGLDVLVRSFADAQKPLAAIGAEYTGNMVEVADNFILGKGPAAASAFGFAILEKFAGAGKVAEVKNGMLFAE